MAKKLVELTHNLPCMKKGGDVPRDEMGILQEISGLDSSAISTRFDSFTRLATRGEADIGIFSTLLNKFVPEPLKVGVFSKSPTFCT